MLAHGELWTIKELFVYPNEFIYWSVQIVMYPYMTGLVAGAFVIVNLSYGIWQGWWVAALFFAATFCVGAMPATAMRRRESDVAYRPVTANAHVKR